MEQALYRELKEELDIELNCAKYLYSFPNQYLYKNISYFTLDTCFEIRLKNMPEIKVAAEEVSDFCWLDVSNIDIDRFAFESTRLSVQRYALLKVSESNKESY